MRTLIFAILLGLVQIAFGQLKPTETNALVNVLVIDFKSKVLPNETVIFISAKTKKTFKIVTNNLGKAEVLLPEGDTYDIEYRDFIEQVNYSKIELPTELGAYTVDVIIKFEPEKVFELKNVFYDTGKSTLKPESYPALNTLVELLKAKPALIIEIAGHTDNNGSMEMNMELSQNRAQSVVNYLVSKGIAKTRLTAKGYGFTQPVESNDTEEGRQKNRRTEVRILSE